MILQNEIIETARKNQVKTLVVDKDWILGHFLNAMFTFEDIKSNFVFKGGTSLRKCYIPDYRFSEDLDFTLLDEKFTVDSAFINKITRKAEGISGIKFSIERNKVQKSNEIEQGYEIKVKYWGADHKPTQTPLPPRRWQTAIKLDITHTENILTDIQFKSIFHNFSDNHLITSVVPVYSINEIMAEKLRSLIQRNRPRDIYDLWILLPMVNTVDYSSIKELLTKKCRYKNIAFSNVDDFINDKKGQRNKREWESSLNNHLPAGMLPDFDKVYSLLNQLIERILKS